MPQPESYGTPPSWDKKSSDKKSLDPVGEAFSAREVTDVFKTLAAHGGGTGSFDLALDLVLNEVVEEARLATRASGAAIALAREGEMVCRATTGGNAPDLGVRLETTSGLSGACLQTGTIQQCSDTETDLRVNAEACRRLGVRSILILPLGDGKDRFGILEVFSSWPNAFSDRDVSTLQALARRVVENKRGAEREDAVLPSVEEKVQAPAPSPSIQLSTASEVTSSEVSSSEYAPPWESEGGGLVEERSSRGRDVWTFILGVLVIAVAVVLGLALGWREAIVRGLGAESPKRASASSATTANRGTDSAGEQTVPAPAGDLAPAAGGPVSVPKTTTAATAVDPPSGGLVVTQNGKVIFRSPAAEPRAATGTRAAQEGAGDVSASRLIHRVEPLYPPDARAQHLQGLVALDVQIGGEGAVHNIAVVEGNPVLAEAAVQAVRQWRYRPYSVDGRPVEMQTRITIRFTLPPS
jgi:TonB family protein